MAHHGSFRFTKCAPGFPPWITCGLSSARGRSASTFKAAGGRITTFSPVLLSGRFARPDAASIQSQRSDRISDFRAPVSTSSRIAAIAQRLTGARSSSSANASLCRKGHKAVALGDAQSLAQPGQFRGREEPLPLRLGITSERGAVGFVPSGRKPHNSARLNALDSSARQRFAR
jgi:hypothetical protein